MEKKFFFLHLLLLLLHSFLCEHFILWALKPKLETHEAIFVTTLGKDANENKNSLASRQLAFVQIPSLLWRRWRGGWPVVIPLEEVCSFARKRLKMAYGRVGGWVQKKLLAFLTYSYIFSSNPTSIIWFRSIFLWIQFYQHLSSARYIQFWLFQKKGLLLPSPFFLSVLLPGMYPQIIIQAEYVHRGCCTNTTSR